MPEYKRKAFELYGFQQVEGDDRSLLNLMRECFLDFYTKSIQPEHLDKGVPDFHTRVSVEQKDHQKIIEKIQKGETLPYLDKDPSNTKELDQAPDLSSIEGYTLKSQGTFLTHGQEKTPVNKNVGDLVHKLAQRARDRKQSTEGGNEIKEEDEEAELEKTPDFVDTAEGSKSEIVVEASEVGTTKPAEEKTETAKPADEEAAVEPEETKVAPLDEAGDSKSP